MATPPSKDPDASTGVPATLGDILYADPQKPLVFEDEWIAIVDAIAAGDQQALRALYDRLHRLVFTLAYRLTNDRQTAEELTLDVFQGVWQRAADYDPGGGTVVGWVMNQARSRAIDRVRFEQRRKRVNPYPDEPLPQAAPREPQDAAAVSERARGLREALTQLSPVERQAIEVAFFAELSHAEAAERLGEPLGTVKTRIRSGLQKLRHALSGAGREP